MATVLSNNLLVNGLRTEFVDTYQAIRNRQADSRLGLVMDLTITATNRNHDFAYLNAAPHMTFWERGESIPTDAMDSVQFNVPIYEWARRIPWSKWDRKDDQTQSLFDSVKNCAESAALLPEIFFFDLLTNNAGTLPAIPKAPDGLDFFASSARFEDSNGNIVSKSGDGLTTIHGLRNDYYSVLERFMAFQDGKGQPLLSKETIDAGIIILHASADTELFEETFLGKIQMAGMAGTGVIGATVTGGGSMSNVMHDAGRNVDLWGTSRLATGAWYAFLKNPPKQATFLLDREGVQEFSSLEGDNNGDHTRSTAEEYVQWECRHGAGIALPYGAIKVA